MQRLPNRGDLTASADPAHDNPYRSPSGDEPLRSHQNPTGSFHWIGFAFVCAYFLSVCILSWLVNFRLGAPIWTNVAGLVAAVCLLGQSLFSFFGMRANFGKQTSHWSPAARVAIVWILMAAVLHWLGANYFPLDPSGQFLIITWVGMQVFVDSQAALALILVAGTELEMKARGN